MLDEKVDPRFDARLPFEPPDPVRRPLLLHRWSDLSLLHWSYQPDEVAALLPDGLEPDVFDGSAWVGLVPFHCTIRPAGSPRVPWLSSFPEMNVRTYVRGPDGDHAVWFISLDAGRLPAVLLARAGYGLAYYWSRLAFNRVGDLVTYEARRGRSMRGATASIALLLEDPVPPHDTDPLERWLTNRWRFFCSSPLGLATGRVAHPSWPLRRAHLLHCEAGLVSACGLPPPSGEPLVLFGGTVDVRMSRPHLVNRRAGTGASSGESSPVTWEGGLP